MLSERFRWTSYDLNSLLPEGWKEQLLATAQSDAQYKVLRPRSVTSREANPDDRLPAMTVGGSVVRSKLPWLYSMYRGVFLELAKLTFGDDVVCAVEERYGCVMNVQRGQGMRYECHVDSNPVEGLLYATDHPPGSGGELIVANSSSATTVDEVDKNCSVVYPVAGNLVFFDARKLAHYVRALEGREHMRIVVAMNFYTSSCPESSRPTDLDRHLFGEV